MCEPVIVPNPTALTKAVLARGLTVTEAVKAADVDYQTFRSACRGNRITFKTASKLTKAFGDDVVTVVNPKRRELEQLVAMRAEFADRYPTDKARLETLDEMIQESRAELEGGNHDVH